MSLKVKGLYANGMVLQRGMKNCAFGTADANSQVKLNFRNADFSSTCDAEGNWKIEFEVGEAGGSFDATSPMVSQGMQTPPPTVPIQTTTTAIPADKNTAQTLYDGGIKAFDQRRYKDAVAAFKSFTSNYPKHQLAGNAAFWEGESYYQLGEYGRAALAYQEVLDKYKTSPKYQASLVKQGIAFHNAGKKSAAKERLQELVSRYPSSSEASRAKQFMTTNKL